MNQVRCPQCDAEGKGITFANLKTTWDAAAKTSTGGTIGANRFEWECPNGHLWLATPAETPANLTPHEIRIAQLEREMGEMRAELERVSAKLLEALKPEKPKLRFPADAEAWLEAEIAPR